MYIILCIYVYMYIDIHLFIYISSHILILKVRLTLVPSLGLSIAQGRMSCSSGLFLHNPSEPSWSDRQIPIAINEPQ